MTGDPNIVAGAQRCLFGTARRHCGTPAVIHTRINERNSTMSCAGHVYWWTTHPHLDRHPIGGACGLPNALWCSSPDGGSHCEIEGLTEADLAVSAVAGA